MGAEFFKKDKLEYQYTASLKKHCTLLLTPIQRTPKINYLKENRH